MNPGVVSVNNSRVVFAAMALLLAGGIAAYMNIGRLEDPEFTIKEARIITLYPGASAEEVAQEVTNPIETAVQQLGQLERVTSESLRGRSVVSAVIKDHYDRDSIPQVWDELRRKIADVQPQLPPSARGASIVVDNFGDVYGIFFAITGEGYSFAEVRRYTEFLRRELLAVPGVKSIELFGAQQEVVFLEISRHRLTQLGINEEQLYAKLQERNIAADGGRVRVGDQHIPIDPHGEFETVDAMLDIVIGSDSTGRQLRLGDVATLVRGDQDPPRRLLKFDGKSAVGLGISTIQGGNVVTLGEAIRAKLDQIEQFQPIGIEIGEINFQPEAVSQATGEFIFNLLKAVTIVFVVLLLAMGRKTGLIIGIVLFLTIMSTFFVMHANGDILMERISLGALIIALCMLTDNAIIVIEGIKVGIEAGRDKLEVVREVVAENQWPLFGATAIGVIAFAAIGLSDDSTGEYTQSLFWVIFIALSLSWVSSITVTPLLSYLIFSPNAKSREAKSGSTKSNAADSEKDKASAYDSLPFRIYRNLLILALRYRWLVVVLSIAAFIASIIGFGKVTHSFFPPATRPQFLVDVFLPAATHIRETEDVAARVESLIRAEEGVKHVTAFIGGGGPRFLLVYSPENENPAYVQFLVEVDDWRAIDSLIPAIQQKLDEGFPDANAIAKKFLLGPGEGGRIQARFRGPDADVLKQLGDEAQRILREEGDALCVRSNWREPVKVIRPTLLDAQARRNGITRIDVARALESSFEGRRVGFFREPGDSATGQFPQEARLLPIIARPPLAERDDASALASVQIWSPVAGRMIPLSQVSSGSEVVWEDPIVMRRDRFPTLTVHGDPRTGLPSQLLARVRDSIEAIELPEGYTLEWGGEYENSRDARAALALSIPAMLALMVFIVVALFNSVRATLLIWLIMPLALIGVTAGLLLTGMPFGFMALLGVLALGGEQIKNQIVVLSKILTESSKGKDPYLAILDGGAAKMRPVCMVAITTVLGMIPLVKDPFFGAMAVCIMFGLSFAAVLSLIVTPVLYAIFFGIHEPTAKKRG
jgi:multidrug efflux pump subunit AcrB